MSSEVIQYYADNIKRLYTGVLRNLIAVFVVYLPTIFLRRYPKVYLGISYCDVILAVFAMLRMLRLIVLFLYAAISTLTGIGHTEKLCKARKMKRMRLARNLELPEDGIYKISMWRGLVIKPFVERIESYD